MPFTALCQKYAKIASCIVNGLMLLGHLLYSVVVLSIILFHRLSLVLLSVTLHIILKVNLRFAFYSSFVSLPSERRRLA